MKRYYKNLLKFYCILAICSQVFFAKANSSCATQLTTNQANYNLETQAKRDSVNLDEINGNIQIPVVAHILESDSLTNEYFTINEGRIQYAMGKLNSGFEQAGFEFNLCQTNRIPFSPSLEKIYNSNYPTSNEFIMTDETLVPRALNIYFVPEAIAPNGESVCGWASFPAEYYLSGKNWIVVREDCAINNSTLIHEVGHYFNLYHTHQGKNPNLGITEAELVDCSNCGPTVGDGVEDTPAEPFMRGKGLYAIVNEDCEILCEEKDTNNDVYIVGDNTNYNYMSYAPFDCRSHFTPQQIERMKKSYLVDRNYLSNLCPGDTSNVCDPLRDKKVLYKLYNSLGGPIPNSWEGVIFNLDSCVTSIELESMGLTGEIPLEIDDLNFLTTLNLSNNNICGELPSTIGNLHQLQTLNLSNNQISGEIPGKKINGLGSLSILDLSYNFLSDYVPYQISKLDSLTQLKLIGNKFSGCLHPDLISFINQDNLVIDDFNIGLDVCTKCNIGDWTTLKYIYENMDNNCIILKDGSLVDDLLSADSIPNGCNLDTLSTLVLNEYGRVESIFLWNCGLTDSLLIDSLNNKISLLSDLQNLYLDSNNINDTIPGYFADLKKLEYVGLSGNPIPNCFPVKLTKLCGQATVITGNHFPSSDLWNEFCNGTGGYCEETSDYVMPGDFNNDKKVDNLDLIYWSQARYLEDTIGKPRVNAHTAWLPQYSQNWEDSIWGVNKKHLDANGDSIICKSDLQAFYQNFGKGTAIDTALDNVDRTGPEIVYDQFTLSQESDDSGGFNLTINSVNGSNSIQTLTFSIDLGTVSFSDAYLDFSNIEDEQKPVFENIHNTEGTNRLEISIVWEDGKPPPIGVDPFGRLFIIANDDGSDGEGSAFSIDNINIFGTSTFTSIPALEISFDNGINGSECNDHFEFAKNEDLNGNYTYSARDSIIAEAYVNGCTNINFLSGGSIELNPGFTTQHGVVFCAGITAEPCEVPSNKFTHNEIEMGLNPNPTTNQTTLTFELAEASQINIALVDLTGKPVIKLINNTQKEAGIHQATINTTNLPTGMYYCTLINKETVNTQKLLVVN